MSAIQKQNSRFETFERKAYRVAEFATMIGVSRSFIYHEQTRGNIEIRKIGGRALITRSEADRYTEKHLGSATPPGAA